MNGTPNFQSTVRASSAIIIHVTVQLFVEIAMRIQILNRIGWQLVRTRTCSQYRLAVGGKATYPVYIMKEYRRFLSMCLALLSPYTLHRDFCAPDRSIIPHQTSVEITFRIVCTKKRCGRHIEPSAISLGRCWRRNVDKLVFVGVVRCVLSSS